MNTANSRCVLFSAFLCLKLFISTGLWHDICITGGLCGEAGCALIDWLEARRGWGSIPSVTKQLDCLRTGQSMPAPRFCGPTQRSCCAIASASILQAGAFILIGLTTLGHFQLCLAADPEDLHWQLVLDCRSCNCIFLNSARVVGEMPRYANWWFHSAKSEHNSHTSKVCSNFKKVIFFSFFFWPVVCASKWNPYVWLHETTLTPR